jgi:hypothetical protein
MCRPTHFRITPGATGSNRDRGNSDFDIRQSFTAGVTYELPRLGSDKVARERVGLRFRAEFFNILNHPNFGPPNTDLTSPLFGRSTQTLASSLGSGGANSGFNSLYQIGGPRSIQLALKLQFLRTP